MPYWDTFICVDALDECVPEHRMTVLESLGQILRGSPNIRIFITARPHVRGDAEGRLDEAANLIFIQSTDDALIRFLREKLRKDAPPHIMSSILEAEIMKSIPEISSETYVGTRARTKLAQVGR